MRRPARPAASCRSRRSATSSGRSPAVGERAGRLLGVSEELGVRLAARSTRRSTPPRFRVRQVGLGGARRSPPARRRPRPSHPPAAVALLLVLGAPVARLPRRRAAARRRVGRWQRRVFLELPVVAEQLGMLLSAGCSLGARAQPARRPGRGRRARRPRPRRAAGSARGCPRPTRCGSGRRSPTSTRSTGWWPCSRSTASRRPRAADRRGGPSDPARGPARADRDDRAAGQQVWIPVTVATLVPGVLFLAVPFIEALRLFSRREREDEP